MHAIEWLERGRSKRLEPTDFAFLLNEEVMKDLRINVREEDIDWILRDIYNIDHIGGELSHEQSGFIIGLTAKFGKSQTVQAALKESWDVANGYRKMHILWRLLDDPNLDMEWHVKIFEAILDNWDDLRIATFHYYGFDHEFVLAKSIERYFSQLIPESKKWGYLCTLSMASKFPHSIAFFLELGSRSENAFQREVAQKLRQNLGM